MSIVLKSLKDTEKFAEEIVGGLFGIKHNFWNNIAQKRKGALLICLKGHLGAGKTALVKSLAKALGVKNHITSPTFVIMKTYNLQPTPVPEQSSVRGTATNNKSFRKMVHIDAYRLKSGEELLALGFKDLLQNKRNLIFLEWPENVKEALPKKSATIYLKAMNEERREIKIKLT